MRTIELNVFIDYPRHKVYDHISDPLNMIGLQPFLTTIDVLKEQQNENGITLHPYHTVETFRPARTARPPESRLLGHPFDKAREALEFPTYGRPDIQVSFSYPFSRDNGRTYIKQTMKVVQVSKLLEGFTVHQAKQIQRGLLSNLKARRVRKYSACIAPLNML